MGARKLQEKASASERRGMLKTKKQACSSSEGSDTLKAKKILWMMLVSCVSTVSRG
jgi:hypothetical protein